MQWVQTLNYSGMFQKQNKQKTCSVGESIFCMGPNCTRVFEICLRVIKQCHHHCKCLVFCSFDWKTLLPATQNIILLILLIREIWTLIYWVRNFSGSIILIHLGYQCETLELFLGETIQYSKLCLCSANSPLTAVCTSFTSFPEENNHKKHYLDYVNLCNSNPQNENLDEGYEANI